MNSNKILYIGFNRSHINRTSDIFLRALQTKYNMDFFGPGFCSRVELDLGVEEWCLKNGPYDLLVFDHYIVMWEEVSKRTKPFSGDVINFSFEDFAKHAKDLNSFVRLEKNKKIFIANCDIYGIDEKYITFLENCGAYVIDGSFSMLTLEEKRDVFKIRYTDRNNKGFWYGVDNDNWVNFIKANQDKILKLPHAISFNQFCYTPLEVRKYLFSVPGTNYAERKNVYPLLSFSQKIKKYTMKINDKIYGSMNSTLSIARYSYIHQRYDNEIANSKITYVSGSMYRSPVRKYFEVPALGSMPVGQTMEGFDDLGFQDRVNFIVAETSESVRDVLSNYNEDSAQLIVKNSRNLIMLKHSEAARSEQLSISIEKILDGSFKGSYWSFGEYRHY